ncbi:hypothetical protein [Streptomyces sp. NPDC001415]
MSKLVALPGGGAAHDLNWFATGGLFDEVAAFIRQHVRDERARQAVTAQATSGHLFLADLPEPVLTDVLRALRDELPAYVNEVIYPPDTASAMDYPEIFIARAKSLAHLAGRSIALRESEARSTTGPEGPTVVTARAEPGSPLRGRLLCQDAGDIDFLCDPGSRAEKLARAGVDGSASLCIGTLRLEVGIATHQVLYARGYSPRDSWQAARFDIPDMAPGAVFADPDQPFVPGLSVALDQSGSWHTQHDDRSGWLRISATGEGTTGLVTLVADGIGIGVHAGHLVSVWLRCLPS